MNKDLIVGSLSAQPGEKVTGINELTIAGKPFSLPMFLINGKLEGPTLVVTGGVHAAEYASIAAALELGQTLTPEEVCGRVIVVPVVNQAGFPVRSIYLNPMDGVNLNRVFPGKPDGSASEQIAFWLMENVIKQGDFFIDLHGGDMIEALIPFALYSEVGNPKADKLAQEMAEAFGIKFLVVRNAVSGSTYSGAAGAGIPAMLAESGGQGIWPEEDVALLTNGVKRVMRHFAMLPGGEPEEIETIQLQEFIWLRSEHAGFWYPGVAVGDQVQEGQILGKIKDVWGHVLQTAIAPKEGRVLFLVSSLAINPNDPLLSIGR